VIRPIVAIPAYGLEPGRVRGWRSGSFGVPGPYVDAVRRAGMRPLILPPGEPHEWEPLVDAVHALLLVGGGDVDPARYGAEPHPTVYGIDPDRDETEVELTRAAVERGLPVLAVCRGAQVVNVALGGTLIQHVPDIPGTVAHGTPGGEGPVTHEVKVEAGTLLAEACAAERLTCASHHHQAVDRLGDGLIVSARSEDGLIEAFEAERGWLVAVQWHPEETAAGDPQQHSLFDALGARARERLAAAAP
jgi:putative glutamine amidotransferase